MAADQAWLQSLDVPDVAMPVDARAFFNVPPDPESQLDENISKKRRAWKSKVRSRKAEPQAVAAVEEALRRIEFLAQYLKRGGDGPLDLGDLDDVFRQAPQTRVDEVGQLWGVVERLLALGQLEEALRVAHDARERFPESLVAHLVFAWVAAQVSRFGTADDRLREQGLESADEALKAAEPAPEAFQAKVTLLLDLHRAPMAMATLEDAQRRLPQLPTSVEVLYTEALIAIGDVDQATRRAIAAVEADVEDLAVRSAVTQTLVQALQFTLLPIRSPEQLARFQRVTELAAWCAEGAAEAEAMVRPFRMWAVIADNRMYAGDVALRAYLSVLTGFLLVPVLNRLRARPQWQIIANGPSKVSQAVFDEVALGGAAQFVHQPIRDRLDWWEPYFQQVAERRRKQAA